MNKGKSLFYGFVFGSAIGATATLLSAPSSGKDLRKQVLQQGNEWKGILDNLKNDGIRLKKQITETSKESAVLIKGLTQEMKESVVEWKTAVKPHQQNIQNYIEQIESSLKELEDKIKK